MIVAIETTTFASLRATRATFLPLVVKHGIANSIEVLGFVNFFRSTRFV